MCSLFSSHHLHDASRDSAVEQAVDQCFPQAWIPGNSVILSRLLVPPVPPSDLDAVKGLHLEAPLLDVTAPQPCPLLDSCAVDYLADRTDQNQHPVWPRFSLLMRL